MEFSSYGMKLDPDSSYSTKSLKRIMTGTISVDAGSIDSGAEYENEYSVSGVNVGDPIILSPNDAATAGGASTILWVAWVSAENKISIRISNVHASTTYDVSSASWRYVVYQFDSA